MYSLFCVFGTGYISYRIILFYLCNVNFYFFKPRLLYMRSMNVASLNLLNNFLLKMYVNMTTFKATV